MATIMLLAYYTAAISFAPQIMSDVYKKTAMEVSNLSTITHHINSYIFQTL